MRLTPRERWIGGVVAAAAALYVWFTLQPDLLFSSTTTNGGDTGAHVWWPAYLRDHLLPNWRLSGWAPDWYAGFPAGHFYFPLPALLVVVLDLVLPYNVAFKLVTALGPVALPAAAYAFGRGIGARWPAPPLFAVATLPYLFFTGYNIYGGNLFSNLAGEFSFTIALCLALCFLGALGRALDTRSSLALPAALLAATAMSHIIVTIFAAAGAVVIWLWRRPVRNLRLAAAIGGVGTLLTAVWSLPLVARLGYAGDMNWEKEKAFRKWLLPTDLRWAFVLALVALLVGILFVRKVTLSLAVLAFVFGLAFVLMPETRLWNARLLPFYYLMVMFLAAIGVAEIAGALGRAVPALMLGLAMERPNRSAEALPAVAPGEIPEPLNGQVEGQPDPPPEEARVRRPPLTIPTWAVSTAVVLVALVSATWYTHETRGPSIPYWIKWNYSGYEAKPAYPEFRELLQTMEKLPPGRALWEPSSAIDKYGTSMALMLLPHFTDGRIASMEGLYFESSASMPAHFKMTADVAKQPSNPVRDLRYGTLEDFDRGVRHMRLFGLRYFMAQSDEVKAAADAHAGLRLVAETGRPDVAPHVARWRIYEVADANVVEPLRYEPVVVEGVEPADWIKGATPEESKDPSKTWWQDWFDDPGALDRPLAGGGPRAWRRAAPEAALDLPKRDLPAVTVSDVESGDDFVRFKVSRTGVPVLVKTSYFPNWRADGAQGPWRVTPNLMVVVPTEKEVSLHYGRTSAEYAGIFLSLLGLVGLVLLARWRPAPLSTTDEKADEAEGDLESDDQPEEEPAPLLA